MEVAERIDGDNSDEEVRQILKGMGISEEDLYDRSSDTDLYNDALRPNLTEEEIEDAIRLKRFKRGLMVVTGDPGSGKGLFANMMSYKMKRYYDGCKALLDYKAREPFGPYLPFDDLFLNQELGKMAEQSKVRSDIPQEIDRKDSKKIKEISSLAEKWVRSREGEIYLSNSVLVLEEFKRYMHNRRPMNPLGITLGHIITWWRHLNILIIGMTPFLNEIDVKACQQYITHEVKCTWGTDNNAWCSIYQTSWVSSQGVLRVQKRPTLMPINGWLERPELGLKYVDENGEEHYNRYYDLYNSTFLPSIEPARR